MVAIARIRLEPGRRDVWPAVVTTAAGWCRDQAIGVADAILVVPFAQHLPLAREAWSRLGGWLPRIETTQTLTRSLGPPAPVAPGEPTFDPATDRLVARQLLLADTWGADWARRDPRGFDHAVASLVQTAHAIGRAAVGIAPEARPAHWATARGLLAAAGGPGGVERMLAKFALEWMASAFEPSTDRLFLQQPSAWMIVQAGGPDALAMALAGEGDRRALVIDTDAPSEAPLAFASSAVAADVAVCADFEDEALRTVAAVLGHLSDGRRSIALIAHDRLLVRRVRALLARQRVPLRDETGWKLDTTRAGARLTSLLRAAEPRASTDTWLDWIKGAIDVWPRLDKPLASSAQLEAWLRRHRFATADAVVVDDLPPLAQGLWLAAASIVVRLRERSVRGLSGWSMATRDALDACGLWKRLSDDEAGRQLIAALRLDAADGVPMADGAAFGFDGFVRWVDDALEAASFLPEGPPDPAVVVTPLERAMLRPFDAAVFPGCDEKRLGASHPPHPLLDDATAVSLGLPGAAARRESELQAFVQLLRLPRITFLRRQDDDGEPLAASPLLARLNAALVRAGHGSLARATDGRVDATLTPAPVPHPRPSAPQLLPTRLSASACEALRVCPYRFHARHMLKLREPDELDDEVEKRDYGTWLHAVLEIFHATRAEPAELAVELARMTSIADDRRKHLRLDEAGFLPYGATFARFAPRYLEWLHARDVEGAQWLEAERTLTVAPPEWRGIEMHGVIDRIDSAPGDDGPVTQLIDYKTGSATGLRDKVRHPQEDTQLAFYAALMAGQSAAGGAVGAMYLAIDDGNRVTQIPHPDVEATARWLVEGIGRDLDHLRAGAPLPALGEGRTCDFCEARGLCRRDHWAESTDPAETRASD